MQTENDTPKPEDSPEQTTGEGCSGATCSASWYWERNGDTWRCEPEPDTVYLAVVSPDGWWVACLIKASRFKHAKTIASDLASDTDAKERCMDHWKNT